MIMWSLQAASRLRGTNQSRTGARDVIHVLTTSEVLGISSGEILVTVKFPTPNPPHHSRPTNVPEPSYVATHIRLTDHTNESTIGPCGGTRADGGV